ncbi:MAG: glutaredoxin family protein [Thermoleophilia bacterium]
MSADLPPRLFHRWKCPWCAAARQAVGNVGVAVAMVEVPRDRAARTEVIELSGQPRIPVLVDGDEVIAGSQKIVRHLYAKYGGPDFARSVEELDREIEVLNAL